MALLREPISSANDFAALIEWDPMRACMRVAELMAEPSENTAAMDCVLQHLGAAGTEVNADEMVALKEAAHGESSETMRALSP